MKTKMLSQRKYGEEMRQVRTQLDQICRGGFFQRVPGQSIWYECYERENARGWIAISHGFLESTLKYTELIWYFVQEGWNVAICDHRGHGKSVREVEENWLTHVERFQDYSDDFIYFLKRIVVPQTEGLPLFLLGHSMGGAIAAHVMESAPELPVKRLALSSPMVEPLTGGLPRPVAAAMAECLSAAGKGKQRVFAHRPFDGADGFQDKDCCADSYVRYRWYLEEQKRRPEYQTNAASNQWVRESLRQTRKLLAPGRAARITIPVLLLQAGRDTMVRNAKQDQLLALLPDGRKVVFPEARHEIFRCGGDNIPRYVDTVLDFFSEGLSQA